MGPCLELIHVPLDDISTLGHVSYTTQPGVVCRLAKGTLDPTVNVNDEGIGDLIPVQTLEGHHSSLMSTGTLSCCPLPSPTEQSSHQVHVLPI